ncbi:MAG: epoxide hydrolase [Actinobacteria bacterium]|nr:epoxide hydrolase [Actinomycetota bacterium]
MANLEVVPFRIEVRDAILNDLHERLDRTRFPNQIEGIEWGQGAELQFLSELVGYWRAKYDWRATEARLNAFDQVLTEIDGQRIHAIHARSPEPDALPLLLVHGWPGSVMEFLDVIGPLTDPVVHGGEARDAFHVIAPSLPGFAWSGPTHELGWHPRRIAGAFHQLMGALGYERYGAQGGDWGSVITSNVADLHADAVVGLHLNFVVVSRPKGDDVPPLTAEEEAGLAALSEWRASGAGYQEIQGTKPQTLGYALEDSPVGLCAWIVEKFDAWGDGSLAINKTFTFDRLLDNITTYWVTGTATSSARIYWEMRQARRDAIPQARVEVPTGVANYPAEVTKMPRAWVEHRYNVTHWVDQARGGHFAAMEVPDLFVPDVRTFFRTVR